MAHLDCGGAEAKDGERMRHRHRTGNKGRVHATVELGVPYSALLARLFPSNPWLSSMIRRRCGLVWVDGRQNVRRAMCMCARARVWCVVCGVWCVCVRARVCGVWCACVVGWFSWGQCTTVGEPEVGGCTPHICIASHATVMSLFNLNLKAGETS